MQGPSPFRSLRVRMTTDGGDGGGVRAYIPTHRKERDGWGTRRGMGNDVEPQRRGTDNDKYRGRRGTSNDEMQRRMRGSFTAFRMTTSKGVSVQDDGVEG